MEVDIKIVPALPEHIDHIAAHMRQADINEIAAGSGQSPREALESSLDKSSFARTALVNGVPVVMFGVGDINVLAGLGGPWLLGTDDVEKHFVAFLRGSVKWRNQLLERYDILLNVVDARNKASLRWLRWLGFKFSDPINIRGHDFYIFELRSADVRSDTGINARFNSARRGRADAAGECDGGGV